MEDARELSTKILIRSPRAFPMVFEDEKKDMKLGTRDLSLISSLFLRVIRVNGTLQLEARESEELKIDTGYHGVYRSYFFSITMIHLYETFREDWTFETLFNLNKKNLEKAFKSLETRRIV